MKIRSNIIISEHPGMDALLLTTEDDVVTHVVCYDTETYISVRSSILDHYELKRAGLVCNDYPTIDKVLEHIRDELGLSFMFTCFLPESNALKEDVVYTADLLNGVYKLKVIRIGGDKFKVIFGRISEYPLEMYVDAQVYGKLVEYVRHGSSIQDIRNLITYG